MNNQIRATIETIIQDTITHTSPLSGGMISEVVKLNFNNHSPLVAKLSNADHDLTIEAYMLKYLKQHSQLPIPDVIHADPQLLLIDYVDSTTGLSHATQQQLGDMLGQLHQVTSPQFGLERDTLIGPIHQPNPLSDSWTEFFRDHRLLYMADIALQSNNLAPSIYDRLQNLAEKIDDYLIEPSDPVLIHGDMWTTNILVKNNHIVAIIDPAIYYAHNEMELAYMTLFGNFGSSFFDSYQQHIPIDPAFFEVRRLIYGLYPLLVHVTIFGGGYSNSVDATLRQFGF